ncbi:venom serine carboxypeptidase-like [Ischnura elegans]|uniref:venom serine carboxypeptidase-like n=1 Tax=Ischnura elegans TaxID=197161 RepID=UPI001ED88C46|nr:venom serine carboxypeptidase-like [Ischnura elegans]
MELTLLPYIFVAVVFTITTPVVQSSFINLYPKYEQLPVPDDPGEPLFLTPFIENGRIEEGRRLSLVGNLPGDVNITSYAGYLTVNKEFNSNLFFWFFPSEVDVSKAPVILWLQGGPGASSLFGLFTENGPFFIEKDNATLKLRDYSWTKSYSLIYIDNPVGTGYSFTESDHGYATNETTVGKDLYNGIIQFFQLFPELQRNDFYLTGESYAGKYVPALAYTIHSNIQTAPFKINLMGLAMGNGYCDPERMMNPGDYMYQIGLVDEKARLYFKGKEELALKYMRENDWIAAFKVMDETMDSDLSPYKSYFYNVTGFTFAYNYLHDHEESTFGDLGVFVQSLEFRKAVHVGNRPFDGGSGIVERYLMADVMQSVKPWVEELLDAGYKVLVYNGQLDIAVPYPLTVEFLRALNWKGSEEYLEAKREKWMVGEFLAGYSKTAGTLTEVLVRNSGHMVPTDQPKVAFALLEDFLIDQTYKNQVW